MSCVSKFCVGINLKHIQILIIQVNVQRMNMNSFITKENCSERPLADSEILNNPFSTMHFQIRI